MLVLGGVMQCPVCDAEHTSRPRECRQQAILDHVGSCGIGTEHRFECLLKLLNDYVDSNPAWNKGKKT